MKNPIPPTFATYRWPLGLAALSLVVLVVLSLIYWQERVFLLDASFQVFHVIAPEEYFIQVGRYGAVLVQTLPLVLAKLGAPLSITLASYSLSFTLYPLLLFGVLLYLRTYKLALAVALYFLALMAHTFFWIQSEQIQATVLAILTLGLWRSPRKLNKLVRYGGFGLLSLLTLYTYPLSAAALLFGVVYYLWEDRSAGQLAKFDLLLAPLVVGLFALRQFVFNVNWYDSQKLELTDNILLYATEVFSLPATENFINHVGSTYPLLPALLLLVTAFFIIQRRFRQLATLYAAIAGWLLIILTCFYYGPDQFYMESYYLMLGLFLSLPLADLAVQSRQTSKWAGGLLIAALLVRVWTIIAVSPAYEAKLAYARTLTEELQTLPAQRYTIDESRLDMELLGMSYGLPTTTLMLSALDDPDRPRTVLPYAGAPPADLPNWSEVCFPSAWECFGYERFASDQYFRLTDSTLIVELPD